MNDQFNVNNQFNPNPYTENTAEQNTAPETGYTPNFTMPQGEPQPQDTAPEQPQYTEPSYSEPIPPYTAPEQPKKEKKPKKKHTGVLIALVAVLSLVLGAVGGAFGPKLFESLAGQPGGESQLEEPSREDVEFQIGSGMTSSTTITEVAAANADSVVEITTEQVTTGSYFAQQILTGAGSGVVITENGYIITNNQVISGASRISVSMHNGDKYEARLIGTDAKTDIAVIKVEAENLKPATFGVSANLKVGETAIVIGNPLGSLGGTVTVGIISALDREITVEGHVMTLLQTDAAVNPGNSGGGLFNANGELVGIINAKSSGENVEGIGFAIPADTARKIAEELIESGYVSGRAAMGINVVEILDAQTAYAYGVNTYGVYIVSVNEGSGADKAGLKSGDRIIAIGDREVTRIEDVTAALDAYKVGDTLEVIIVREGRTGTAKVVLQDMAAIPAQPEKPNEKE